MNKKSRRFVPAAARRTLIYGLLNWTSLMLHSSPWIWMASVDLPGEKPSGPMQITRIAVSPPAFWGLGTNADRGMS